MTNCKYLHLLCLRYKYALRVFLLFCLVALGFPQLAWHFSTIAAHSYLLVQRKHVACLLFFPPHFGWFLWPFVKSVSLCCVIEQFFCVCTFLIFSLS